ncbi:MAG: LPXTG cell wall anchor domain-containing protein, partial [Clostridia bacterium]|nr:LPXTG cell wall anchor domain-containing protein [Clostridia bacterium]
TNTPSPSITGIADGTNILRPNPTVDTSINTTRTNTTNAITATGESSSVITIVAIVLLMASAFVAFSLRKNGRTQEK